MHKKLLLLYIPYYIKKLLLNYSPLLFSFMLNGYDIPLDYKGFIGVPITFLHKFNPEQFEIIKFRKGDNGKDLSINGKCPYFRILIKNKRIQIDICNESYNLTNLS